MSASERELCDRAEITIQRALNCGWIKIVSPTGREQLHATIRIALNMEVEAGGPYLVQSTESASAQSKGE